MRKTLAACLLFLAACQPTPVPTRPPVVVNHPTWPTPITTYKFDWKVIQVGDKVYVGLEYDQSVEFRVFLEDVKRYIQDSNNVICFYRESLKEMRCYQQKSVDTKEHK